MMKIALVGGIYGMTAAYRERFRITPETTLEHGLRELGHRVDTFGHHDAPVYDRYDVVHVHHLGRGALRAALDASQVPLIFTVHAFTQQQGTDGRSVNGLPRSHKLAMHFVVRRVDGLISLTSAEQRYEHASYNTQGALCRVIPNGIPAGVFTRTRVDRIPGAPARLLYVGQLIDSKRVDSLLRAVSTLRRPFHLKLAYHVPLLEEELMRLATELRIRENVEFLGGQTASQLAQLYNDADLFTFPTAHEALPSVLIEAMLCGTPIVATDVGGNAELLGGFGTMVPANDVSAMAAAIENVLANYEAVYARSAEMSRHALERFSVASMLRAHVDLYQEAVTARTRCRRHDAGAAVAALPVRAFVKQWARA